MGTMVSAAASSYTETMVMPNTEEFRKQSIMASPDELIEETPAGLRLTALENMYKKLDVRGQGYLEDIVMEESSVFVRFNFEEPEEPIELTQYERGLLSYAMPNIQQAITITGRITHERLIYILRTILFAADPREDAKERISKKETMVKKQTEKPVARQVTSSPAFKSIHFAGENEEEDAELELHRRKS